MSDNVTLKEYGYEKGLDYQYLVAVKVAFQLEATGKKPKPGAKGVPPYIYSRKALDTALIMIKSANLAGV